MTGPGHHRAGDPRRERPRRGGSRRPDRPARHGDRTAVRRLERAGRERGRVRGVRDVACGTDRSRRLPVRAPCPIAWPSPSVADSTGIVESGSTWTCAATATSNATSGARPSTSRVARFGRTAGSPRRSADPRRSGRSGRLGAQSRAAHRALSSGRPDRRHASASTRWADPRTSGRSSRRRAWTRTRWRMPRARASASSAARRHGSCAGRRAGPVGTWLAKNRRPFRSLTEAADAGYRPCKICRPVSGGAIAA